MIMEVSQFKVLFKQSALIYSLRNELYRQNRHFFEWNFAFVYLPLVIHHHETSIHIREKDVSFRIGVIKIMMVCLFVCSALFFIFSRPLISVFMNDGQVVTYGGSFLKGFSIALPFFCMDYLTVAVFQALGKGSIAFVFAVARKVVLEIPALYVLNQIFHVHGLAYS